MISGNPLSQNGYKQRKQTYDCMEEKSTDFSKYFYGIALDKKDKKKFLDFSRFMELKRQGLSNSASAKIVGVPKSSVEKWLYANSIPFAARLEGYYQKLGVPKEGNQWLSINSTRGGLFTSPWISVPAQVNRYEPILEVLNQLKELDCFQAKNKQFNYIILGF